MIRVEAGRTVLEVGCEVCHDTTNYRELCFMTALRRWACPRCWVGSNQG